MASESLGKDWGLSQEEALQAHGELVLGFVRCLPKLGPRSEIEKWLRKSEQGDKWNRCLIEGMIVLSETGARDEQTTPP